MQSFTSRFRGNALTCHRQGEGRVTPELAYHSPDGDIRGLEGARQLVIGMRATFPDFHVTAEDVLAEGDKVVIRFTDSGTYEGDVFGVAATGKRHLDGG